MIREYGDFLHVPVIWCCTGLMITVTSTGITIFTRGHAFIRSLENCNIRFLFGEMVFKEGTVNDSMTESGFRGPEIEIPCALMIGFPMSWVRWKALAEMNKMISGSSRLAYLLQNRFLVIRSPMEIL